MSKTPVTLTRYLLHHITARSKFDLHSPFVYNLYSGILKDQQQYPEYLQLEKLHPGSDHKKYYRLLFRLSRWLKPKNICFIGRQDSAETGCLHSGCPESRIFTDNDKPDERFDLIFVDLQSYKEPIEKCFSSFQQHLTEESVFIFWSLDDPMALKKIRRTVQTIPGITVTIDLFYLGLVFVNSNLSREDFRIRF
jgi:hypothetical protein